MLSTAEIEEFTAKLKVIAPSIRDEMMPTLVQNLTVSGLAYTYRDYADAEIARQTADALAKIKPEPTAQERALALMARRGQPLDSYKDPAARLRAFNRAMDEVQNPAPISRTDEVLGAVASKPLDARARLRLANALAADSAANQLPAFREAPVTGAEMPKGWESMSPTAKLRAANVIRGVAARDLRQLHALQARAKTLTGFERTQAEHQVEFMRRRCQSHGIAV